MKIGSFIGALFFLCTSGAYAQHRIAFISDAHIQNIVDHPELVRSMEVQVQSTRLFNENYYALIAALEDAARREITLVVLPGDLTDNGQFVNQEKIKEILNHYRERYGMKFFVTTGNHDPVRPFGMQNEERNFLRSDGSRTTQENRCAGYADEMQCYAAFGFYPQPEYLYWETPFTSYPYEAYTYQEALNESGLDKRQYMLCDSLEAIDASYLVEPVEGLWLLAIDGGVYLPGEVKNGVQTYEGSSVGYNHVLTHKPFLLPWVRKVVSEAKKRNKVLVTYSHYPLADFNDGASDMVRKAWGNKKFDLHRVPDEEVTEAFLDAGIRLHVAGHMHVNDTGVKRGKSGKCLYNIQVPSIATCLPAYKILTAEDAAHFEVETVLLDSVPGYDSLFGLYEKEYAYDTQAGKNPVWSKEALASKDYAEFCDWQFRDLVRVRFIPQDLPEIVRKKMVGMSGSQLVAYAEGKRMDADAGSGWSGYDLILDLYRLRYADKLALRWIPEKRMQEYHVLFDAVRCSGINDELIIRLREIADIFECFLQGEPCGHFRIDLERDRITGE